MSKPRRITTKDMYFQTRMNQETYDLLTDTAEKLGISKAEVVRRGIITQAKTCKA